MKKPFVKEITKDAEELTFPDEFTKRQYEGKLFKSIAEQKFKLARILVEGGVDVNCRLRTGVTPLMLACDQHVSRQQKRSQHHLVTVLLNKNADVNAKDNLGRTALTYAFLNGDKQLVQKLEANGSFGWINSENFTAKKVPRDSVIISSNLGLHFHRWESNDFANALS